MLGGGRLPSSGTNSGPLCCAGEVAGCGVVVDGACCWPGVVVAGVCCPGIVVGVVVDVTGVADFFAAEGSGPSTMTVVFGAAEFTLAPGECPLSDEDRDTAMRSPVPFEPAA